jgi:IS5 family transposase
VPRPELPAADRIEQAADRAAKVVRQIRQRSAGENITDRLVSMPDPDARPIRQGKLRQPNEFGDVFQLARSVRRPAAARGPIVPTITAPGSRNDLLPASAAEVNRLDLKAREVAPDGRSVRRRRRGPARRRPASSSQLASRPAPGTDSRLAEFRVGCEGRISPRTPLRPETARLKGHDDARSWTSGAILAYNLDTLAIRPASQHPQRFRIIPRSQFATRAAPSRGRARPSALPIHPGASD